MRLVNKTKENASNLDTSLNISTSTARSLHESDTSYDDDICQAAELIPSCSGLGRNISTPTSKTTSFSVRETLTTQSEGKLIVRTLDSKNETLSGKMRSAMMRILVAKLVEKHTYYPTNEQKVSLAKDIVEAFPCLKAKEDGFCKGYEHFYDPQSRTGFIEYRLKTIRVKLTPTKKKNKSKGKTTPTPISTEEDADFNENHIKEQISWLKFQIPNEQFRETITNAMDETFPFRRKDINKNKNESITSILEKYPRLADYNGALIDREFDMMEPDACQALGRFSEFYTPRILKYCAMFKPLLMEPTKQFTDDHLRALVLLPTLLPPNNALLKGRKRTRTEDPPSVSQPANQLPSKELLQFVKIGTDIQGFVDSQQQMGVAIQPYLVCAGTPERGGRYFLIVDRRVIDIGSCVLTAMDKLFKTHFVFNVQYSPSLHRFYNFLENCLYKVHDVKIMASVRSFDTTLANYNMNE